MSKTYRFTQSMRAPLFGTVRLGQRFGGRIPSNAKLLSRVTQQYERDTTYDLNGDGKADLTLTEQLEAGKVTGRRLTVTEDGPKGPRSWTIVDANLDGKIDTFQHRTRSTFISTADGNFDGKADAQENQRLRKDGSISSEADFNDFDEDGHPNWVTESRTGTRRDRMPNVARGFGAVQLDMKASALIPDGGKLLSSTRKPTDQIDVYDSNGDGVGDLTVITDFLGDGSVAQRSYELFDPANPTRVLGEATDSFGDGVIDRVDFTDPSGVSWTVNDQNEDGKIDSVGSMGPHRNLSWFDDDQDGRADWITGGHDL